MPSLLDRARHITRELPLAIACRRTAAYLWGIPVAPPGTTPDTWQLDIAMPFALTIPDCATHLTHVEPRDITHHQGVRLTTPTRTALDCARWLPKLDGVAIVDQFLRRGVDLDHLLREATGFRQLRETLNLADPGAASPRESWLRVILMDGGLPRPTTQIRVPLSAGRVAYLDLGWEPYRLAVEYDGHEHHTSPTDRGRDAFRREELRQYGWRVIPVRRDVIPAHKARLLENVANALIECGWQPTSAQTTRILTRIRATRFRPHLPPHPGSAHVTRLHATCTPLNTHRARARRLPALRALHQLAHPSACRPFTPTGSPAQPHANSARPTRAPAASSPGARQCAIRAHLTPYGRIPATPNPTRASSSCGRGPSPRRRISRGVPGGPFEREVRPARAGAAPWERSSST